MNENNKDDSDDLVSYRVRGMKRPSAEPAQSSFEPPSEKEAKSRTDYRVDSSSNMSNFWNSDQPQDFLTQLLLQIFIERGVGAQQLNQYISQYMRSSRIRAPYKTNKDITSIRGNIVKELNRGSMPFRNFMSKLRLIRIMEMEFTVTLTDSRGYKTVHTKTCRDSTVRPEEDNELD